MKKIAFFSPTKIDQWSRRWNQYYQERYGVWLPIDNFEIALQKALSDTPKNKIKNLNFIQPMHPIIIGPQTAFDVYQKHHQAKGDSIVSWIEGDLNDEFPKDRREKCLYVIIHRGGLVADEKYANKSAREIVLDTGIKTMRLVEYLTFIDFCRFENREQKPDADGITICPETFNSKKETVKVDFNESYGGYKIQPTSFEAKYINRSFREAA